MRRLIHWISLLSLGADVGAFILAETSLAGNHKFSYCHDVDGDGDRDCIEVPVAVNIRDRLREPNPCFSCPYVIDEQLILTIPTIDLQGLVTLDALNQFISPNLQEELVERIHITEGQLDLSDGVTTARSGSNGRDWFINYTDNDSRTRQHRVSPITEISDPGPDSWIIDERLDATIAQDIQMLATM